MLASPATKDRQDTMGNGEYNFYPCGLGAYFGSLPDCLTGTESENEIIVKDDAFGFRQIECVYQRQNLGCGGISTTENKMDSK
jgi:hypothetical protein